MANPQKKHENYPEETIINSASISSSKDLVTPRTTVSGTSELNNLYIDSKGIDYEAMMDGEASKYIDFLKRLNTQQQDEFTKLNDDIQERAAKLDTQLKQNIDDKVLRLETKFKRDAQNIQLRTIETLGVFVALFTVVSVTFKAFEQAESQQVVGVVLVLSGVMILFITVLDLLIKDIIARSDGESSKSVLTTQMRGMIGAFYLVGFSLIVFGVILSLK